MRLSPCLQPPKYLYIMAHYFSAARCMEDIHNYLFHYPLVFLISPLFYRMYCSGFYCRRIKMYPFALRSAQFQIKKPKEHESGRLTKGRFRQFFWGRSGLWFAMAGCNRSPHSSVQWSLERRMIWAIISEDLMRYNFVCFKTMSNQLLAISSPA